VLDFNTIQNAKTSNLTEKQSEIFSDLVWTIKSKTEKDLEISLLLEHKSYRDKKVVFQILEYLANAYKTQIKNNEKLSLIVPIVYYYGKEK
jgi:predicted transposase/invertase (TIGR01784 family)